MLKIGITGTRSGMQDNQMIELFEFFEKISTPFEFHHGDCVGVDVEAAVMAKDFGARVVCHPPIKDELRAFHKSDEFKDPLSYFARNRNIVNETDLLIVVPFQTSPQSHGGTWYTHDYAIKIGKPVMIIYPVDSIAQQVLK